MKKLSIALIIVVIVLAVRIIWENSNDSYKQDIHYKEYEVSERDKYLSFKNNVISQIKANLNMQQSPQWANDYDFDLFETSNQFEGPQVHLFQLSYQQNKETWLEFRKDSASKNLYPEFSHFDIHSLLFDPDGKTTGKPDVKVTVIPPKIYKENRDKNLQDIYQRITGGDSEKVEPFKTYTKEVYSFRDSIITIENIKMELWLTEFEVTVETKSWRHAKEEDERGEKAEINNQRLNPFTIVFKVYPYVSPWYVKTKHSADVKADMAVGSIYCSKIVKKPKETTQIGVTPSAPGTSLPLIKQEYYSNMDRPDNLIDDRESDNTIWNKPIFAKLHFSDIGSYRNLLGKGDEQITFTFVMPLLVRGSWDIQIPPSIVPKYVPSEPYRRGLFNILVPKWGLKGFGQGLSAVLYIAIIVFVVLYFFPKLKLF